MRTALKTRTLGNNGPTVSALGLGAMGMSDFYGPADRVESVATLKAALDEGITLLDTGDFYGSGHNEILVGEAIRGRRRDEVVISVKFGALRDPQGNFTGGDPELPRLLAEAAEHRLHRRLPAGAHATGDGCRGGRPDAG